MPYPSVDEFKSILTTNPLETVVKQHLFQGEPYVFREFPGQYTLLRQHLSSTLNARNDGVIVIGSGRIGFSLNPDNFGRQFSERSDIDILVVNETLFDHIWLTMLKWNYPRRYKLAGVDFKWAKLRQDDLYWGWFRPDKIRFDGLSFPDVLKPLDYFARRKYRCHRIRAGRF